MWKGGGDPKEPKVEESRQVWGPQWWEPSRGNFTGKGLLKRGTPAKESSLASERGGQCDVESMHVLKGR